LSVRSYLYMQEDEYCVRNIQKGEINEDSVTIRRGDDETSVMMHLVQTIKPRSVSGAYSCPRPG
jgi:hypothetical protein